jgi:hypothetical protein
MTRTRRRRVPEVGGQLLRGQRRAHLPRAGALSPHRPTARDVTNALLGAARCCKGKRFVTCVMGDA